MKILCLGGAGKICRESIFDLVQTSSFRQITVADANPAAGSEVVQWLRDPRVDFVTLDANDSLVAAGKACGPGAVAPESAFEPAVVFAELEKRSIFIHEEVTYLS